MMSHVSLRILEAREDQYTEQGRLGESEVLSTRMRESWEPGRFWLALAARRTLACDTISWMSLGETFFGKNTSRTYDERLHPPVIGAGRGHGGICREEARGGA